MSRGRSGRLPATRRSFICLPGLARLDSCGILSCQQPPRLGIPPVGFLGSLRRSFFGFLNSAQCDLRGAAQLNCVRG
jgi:hypothetical protein